MSESKQDAVLVLVGKIIAESVARLEMARGESGYASIDQHEDRQAVLQKRVKDLRQIRENLELIFADPRI